MPLTEKEKEFIKYWEDKQAKKNNFKLALVKGLRNALIINSLIILSLTTGWYKRISIMPLGQFISFLLGIGALTVFITFFTAHFQREQLQQQYLELKRKQK